MANKTSSSGLGLGSVLFIVFLILKLTGNINWSWWWVTAPLWIPITLGVAIIGVVGIVMILLNKK
jgi:hypothetical protein